MTAVPCVVLAGGLGTRLRAVLQDAPKCLAPVGQRSFLDIQLEVLAKQGIDRFVLSLGHLADQIVRAVERLDVPYRIDYIVERSPLGTGGATLNALEHFGLNEVLVANGDTLLTASFEPMLRPLDLRANERMRVAAITVANRRRYGGLTVAGTRVSGFVEKGVDGPGLINAGLYRLHRQAFETFLPGSLFSMESAVIPRLVREGLVRIVQLDGTFTDIGVPEDYEHFCRYYDRA